MTQYPVLQQTGPQIQPVNRGLRLLKRHILTPALDLIFPPVCVSCERVGSLLCEDCVSTFIPAQLAQPAHPLTDIRCLGVFDEALQKSIHALKYDSATDLAMPLGKLMATAISEAQWTQGLIIPVPLHKKRYQERGYNQAALLSQVIADQLGWQQNTESLARFRDTPSPVCLNAQERRQNMVDAFMVNDPEIFRDHEIILIDDVYTTGATLRECAKALFKVGVRTVRAVVAAQASQSAPT